MKKAITLSVLALFVLCVLTVPGTAQTAEEILNKMVDAQGGRAIFTGLEDMTVSGDLDLLQQGLSGTFTTYKKEPDKRRMDFEVMGMIITQCYDGETAWMTNPQSGEVEDMPEAQAADFKRQAMPIISMLDPEKFGISFVLKDKETVDGKECYVLEQTYQDGSQITMYIDPDTYLSHQVKSDVANQFGGRSDVVQILSDFREESGMVMAHSITSFMDGEEYLRIAITEVKINTGMEDSLFAR